MNVFSSIGQIVNVPWVFISAAVAALIVILAGLRVRGAITADGGVLPDEGFTIRNAMEVVVEQLAELGQMTIGDEYRRYFPVVGTIFLFVLISNVMSLIPGLLGSTSDSNTTFAWAIIAFGVYNFVGIKTHGWKYIYHLMGPTLWTPTIGGKVWHVRLLAPLFLPLESVLHLARIATLSIRLLANMFADHAVVVTWLKVLPFVVPAVFLGLGLLVSFLQAAVFALLTMIYIGEALEESH
jgi:F-type H+-transporting ATPase subunit a